MIPTLPLSAGAVDAGEYSFSWVDSTLHFFASKILRNRAEQIHAGFRIKGIA